MHIPTGPVVATAVAAGLAFLASTALGAEKTFDLPAFTAVDIASGIDANITVGAAQSILAESPDQGLIDRVKITVVGGELKAWFDWDIADLFNLGLDRQITLTISVPELTEAEASSGADVVIAGMTGDSIGLEASSGADLNVTGLAGGTVRVEASSGAGVSASGTCTTGTFQVSSGADIAAAELQCTDVTAEASSGANAEVFASASVKAEASSGADIIVSGAPPQVESETSSGGDITIE